MTKLISSSSTEDVNKGLNQIDYYLRYRGSHNLYNSKLIGDQQNKSKIVNNTMQNQTLINSKEPLDKNNKKNIAKPLIINQGILSQIDSSVKILDKDAFTFEMKDLKSNIKSFKSCQLPQVNTDSRKRNNLRNVSLTLNKKILFSPIEESDDSHTIIKFKQNNKKLLNIAQASKIQTLINDNKQPTFKTFKQNEMILKIRQQFNKTKLDRSNVFSFRNFTELDWLIN